MDKVSCFSLVEFDVFVSFDDLGDRFLRTHAESLWIKTSSLYGLRAVFNNVFFCSEFGKIAKMVWTSRDLVLYNDGLTDSASCFCYWPSFTGSGQISISWVSSLCGSSGSTLFVFVVIVIREFKTPGFFRFELVLIKVKICFVKTFWFK